jgi:hypothetical protein
MLKSAKKVLEVLPSGISCRLNVDELAERGAAWSVLVDRVEIVEQTRAPGRFGLAFRATTEDVQAIERLVEAERVCCDWATWSLSPRDDGAVLAVAGDEELLAPLADAFLARR